MVGAKPLCLETEQLKKVIARLEFEEKGLLQVVNDLKNFRFSMDRLSAIPSGERATMMLDSIIQQLSAIGDAKIKLEQEWRKIIQDFELADQYFATFTTPSQFDSLKSSFLFPMFSLGSVGPYQNYFITNADQHHPLVLNLMYAHSSTSLSNVPYNLTDMSISGIGMLANGSQISGKIQVEPSSNTFEVEKDGLLGSPGIGNANCQSGIEDQKLSVGIKASLVDSNKGIENGKFPQKVLSLDGDVMIPAPSQLDEMFLAGALISEKIEGNMSDSKLADEKSPVSLNFKLGNAEAKAGIENHSVGAEIKANPAKVGVNVELLNWFGYEPLDEWFGVEWDPYIVIEASIGSAGVKAQVGMENEIYAAYGIGLGIKFGAEKD
ncbi:hypothetical protein J2S13_000358 [Oikeobacillus pervagus]|uniref:Uncharacterized protein n=1 Tax=Oikeobacillus pervagus TaxID=1325931 RepID=A0AAJ1WI30_9BACI|nr:hypothetical protein [Oikeobacillus pervagus]MDQ0213963.1 hypothetical protein [Oikeobacillus pervagus]